MKLPPKPAARPLRLGGKPALKTAATVPPESPAVSGFRAKIYQAVLSLLEVSDKLTLDLFRQPDGYGFDWRGLARQAAAHYRDDALQLIHALHGWIMSKDGAQFLPKGLYREFLAFLEPCDEFQKWARSAFFDEAVSALAPDGSPEPSDHRLQEAIERLQKACQEIQQRICIFENERASGEESFFA